MAERKPEGAEVEQPSPKKKTKLLIIVGIAVFVLVLIGGGGAFLLLKKKGSQAGEDGEGSAQEETVKDKKEEPPIFVKLEPFTVKLQTETQDAYLQTTPELRVRDAAVGEKIKQYMPEIRYSFLLILSAKKASEIATPQGVQQLSSELRVAVNGIVGDAKRRAKAAPGEKASSDDAVQSVLFTSFIVQ